MPETTLYESVRCADGGRGAASLTRSALSSWHTFSASATSGGGGVEAPRPTRATGSGAPAQMWRASARGVARPGRSRRPPVQFGAGEWVRGGCEASGGGCCRGASASSEQVQMTFMDQCVGTNDTVRMREEMVSPRKEKEHTTMASRKGHSVSNSPRKSSRKSRPPELAIMGPITIGFIVIRAAPFLARSALAYWTVLGGRASSAALFSDGKP
mmetsp:Transcript_10845/g.34488  ORF Transcript_10845/g.34488 Transcript_10845/m.34488 type:complete len:213 (-) Transcript_10845:20-658(-)